MPKAIIAGGGIAGLASAIALEQAGWTVSIHERAPEIRPLGAALSLWPNATAALDSLGLLAQVTAAGAPLNAMFVGDQAGKPIMAARRMTSPALMVTRAALQHCLASAVISPVVLDDAINAFDQDSDCVTTRFADGRTETTDLLIDAGGIRSPIANAMIDDRADYRGYGGVIALSDRVDGQLNGVASEYWGRHERFGLFEITDNRRYWFFMQTQEANAIPLTHGEVSEKSKTWPSSIAEAIDATPSERLIPFSIHAKPPPKRLGSGRIICVGDAAHAMEPNLGQGACQALEDAAALALLALSKAPEALLPAFEKLRLMRVRNIVGRAAEARSGAHGSPLMQSTMRTVLRTLPQSFINRISRDVQTMPDYRP
jgi:2-polyprenyl-6-methoxyphenol hydroxylase-like FAD-dependent oxidoreductase